MISHWNALGRGRILGFLTPQFFSRASVLLVLFVALQFSNSAAHAQSAGRIISIAQKIKGERDRDQAELEREAQLSQRLDKLQSEFFEEESRRVNERDLKLAELLTEKELTRKELAAGLFCSQCKRSKSKIERQTKKPFPVHLKDVNGKPIAMSSAEIQKQMEAYDKQIAELVARANKQLEGLRRRHRKNADSLGEQLVELRVRRAMRERRLGRSLRSQLAEAIRSYKQENAERDASWQDSWIKRILAQRTGARIYLLRQEPAIERARLALSLHTARNELELADSLEERLRELIETRRVHSEDDRQRAEELHSEQAKALAKRQLARASEEGRIVDALTKAQLSSYSPMGVQLGQPWHHQTNTRIDQQRRSTALKLRDIHEQYQGALQESRFKLSGLSTLEYAAMRLAGGLGPWLAKRPEVVKNNLRRLRDGFQSLRDFAREKVAPRVAKKALKTLATKGVNGLTPKSFLPNPVLTGTRLAHQWAVDELRSKLRRTQDGRLSEYEIESLVREIDPSMGVHTWYAPFGDGLRKYLDSVFSFTDGWFTYDESR